MNIRLKCIKIHRHKEIMTIFLIIFNIAFITLAAAQSSGFTTGTQKEFLVGKDAEKIRPDIGAVVYASVLQMRHSETPTYPVVFSSEAKKNLQYEEFNYAGFGKPFYSLTHFIQKDNANYYYLGVLLNFVDSAMRRTDIYCALEYHIDGVEIKVDRAKIKRLYPKVPRVLLGIVEAKRVPETLFQKDHNHLDVLKWVLANSLKINDLPKNSPKGHYFIFATNLDRIDKDDKLKIRVSNTLEGVEGEPSDCKDLNYEGWHVAIIEGDFTFKSGNPFFIKAILFPKNREPIQVGALDSYFKAIKTGHGSRSNNSFPLIKKPLADAYVYAYNYRNWNRSNRGKYDQLRAGWHPTGGESRAYIKFDLSNVDPSKVNKAILRLYHFQTAGNDNIDLGIYRVTGPWEEGTDTYHSGRYEKTAAPGEISWVQQPPIDSTPIVTFNPGSGLYDWTEVDITPLVKQWLSGTPNYGLVIKSIGHLGRNVGASVYHFASRERDPNLDKPKGESKSPTLILSANRIGGQTGTTTTTDTGYTHEPNGSAPDISGTWEWFDGENIHIYPDGTATDGLKGKWQANWNGSGFTYTINWNNGQYIDTLTLHGNTLDGHNQYGTHVWGKRILPGRQISGGSSGHTAFGTANFDEFSLKGNIYFLKPNTSRLPDFGTMSPVGSIYTKELNIPNRSFTSGFPGVTNRFEWFGIRYTGTFQVQQGGQYAFRLSSDDGSKLWIDNQLIINNDGIHPDLSKSGSIYLNPGLHNIQVDYFQGPRTMLALQLFVTPPGGTEKIFSPKYGSNQKFVTSGSAQTATLNSGTYQVEQGRWKSTWRLHVSDGQISGTSEWPCCPGHRIDQLRGTISGNSVVIERDCSGQGWNGPCRQTYRGEIKGDRITGPCSGTGLTPGDTWVLYLDNK